MRLIVNGASHDVTAPGHETLLTTLRERLHLTGTKLVCGRGECGACTVLIDGVSAYSCLTLTAACAGSAVTTIEGVGRADRSTPSRPRSSSTTRSSAASARPARSSPPSRCSARTRIRPKRTCIRGMSGNLCRCGTYPKIVRAVLAAAQVGRLPMTHKRFVTTKVEIEGREETKVVEMPSREPEPWDERRRAPRRRPTRAAHGRAGEGHRHRALHGRHPAPGHAPRRAPPRPRSPAARVTRLDLSPALALSGVRGAIALADVPDVKIDGVRLFDTTIHYANQPVAAICADTLEIAERALHAIVCEVDAGAARPHRRGRAGGGRAEGAAAGQRAARHAAHHQRGDVEAGLRDADVTITREYRTPCRAAHRARAARRGGRVAGRLADRLRIDAGHLHDAHRGREGVRAAAVATCA